MTKSTKTMGNQRLDMIALTISPPPKANIHKQFEKWRERFAELKCSFMLYPEFAYNSKTNQIRLHFHGYIYKNNLLDFQSDIDYLKKICYIDIKDITNLTGWLKYCKKELKITKNTLGLKNNDLIPLKQSNCFKPSKSRDILSYILKNDDAKK